VGEVIVEKTSEAQLNKLLTAFGQGLRGLKALEVTLPFHHSLQRSSSRWKGIRWLAFLQGARQLENLAIWNYLLLETQQDIPMARWWEARLHATDGKLELDKCCYYIMHWEFDSDGNARLTTPEELGGDTIEWGQRRSGDHTQRFQDSPSYLVP
jgi:hypothetical protein